MLRQTHHIPHLPQPLFFPRCPVRIYVLYVVRRLCRNLYIYVEYTCVFAMAFMSSSCCTLPVEANYCEPLYLCEVFGNEMFCKLMYCARHGLLVCTRYGLVVLYIGRPRQLKGRLP